MSHSLHILFGMSNFLWSLISNKKEPHIARTAYDNLPETKRF